jgi:hypothetical protein
MGVRRAVSDQRRESNKDGMLKSAGREKSPQTAPCETVHGPTRDRKIVRGGLLLAVLVGLVSCASTQHIELVVGPDPVVLFVDGEALDVVPKTLELRANRDHTLFFQREGYRSQLVIVRTSEVDGEPRLTPEAVAIELRREASTSPSITIEADEPTEADEADERVAP